MLAIIPTGATRSCRMGPPVTRSTRRATTDREMAGQLWAILEEEEDDLMLFGSE